MTAETLPITEETEALKAKREAGGHRAKLRRILWHDNPRCCYCRRLLECGGGTVEHLMPRSKAGADHPGNLALCCSPCNQFKSHQTVAQFRDKLSVMLVSACRLATPPALARRVA